MKHAPLCLWLLATASAAPVAGGGVEGTLSTEAKLVTKGPASQRDLVVYLVPKEKPAAEAKPCKASVTQKKLNFEPHVLPVQKGTTVEFLNEDQVKHNVFIDTECCKVDVDTDKGESKHQVFDKAGEFPVVCRLHPEMSMHIVVLETAHFVRVEWTKDKDKSTDGKTVLTAAYKLEGVPPGTYTLRTWSKKLKPVEREVVVADGKIERLDLTLEK